MLCERQGILGKIPFRDGKEPEYPRTYLIVNANEDGITVLNVSSTRGKEHKLLFQTNYPLRSYNPPFVKRCFVKLDSAVYVPADKFEFYEIQTLHSGDLLNESDFSEIKRRFPRWNIS